MNPWWPARRARPVGSRNWFAATSSRSLRPAPWPSLCLLGSWSVPGRPCERGVRNNKRRNMCTYGEWLLNRGHGPEALPYLTEGLAGLKRTLDAKHLWIKYVIWNIAYATEGTGRFQEAEALWVEGIHECERDLGPDHRVTA